MSRWFRLYDDLVDDPKVQRLSPENFRGLVNIWCLASKNEGVIPSIDEIAFKLRMTPPKAAKLIGVLREANLIDQTDNGLAPHNWSSRQYRSDTSTERVKRFRKRSKERQCNVSPGVSETPPESETESDSPHTPQGGVEDGFERFMLRYPARQPTHDRPKARCSFKAAVEKGIDQERMIGAAGLYDEEMRKDGKVGTRYVKAAANWIDQHCWENYAPAPSKKLRLVEPGTELWRQARARMPARYALEMDKYAEQGRPFPVLNELLPPDVATAA